MIVFAVSRSCHSLTMFAAHTADSYEDDPDAPGERRLCSSTIVPPLVLSVTEEELRLLRSALL